MALSTVSRSFATVGPFSRQQKPFAAINQSINQSKFLLNGAPFGYLFLYLLISFAIARKPLSLSLNRIRKLEVAKTSIHRRLTRTKSIVSGQNPESQAGRRLCLELRRGGRYGKED